MRDLVDEMGGPRGRPPSRMSDDVEERPVSHIGLILVLHHDTGKAVLVSETGEELKAVWLPRSLVQTQPHGKNIPAVMRDGQRTVLPVVTVTMPEWLAKKNGLI